MKLKVALFCTTVLEHGGGLEKYFMELSKNLCEKFDVQVDVVTMDEDFTMKIVNLLSIYRFKKHDKSIIQKLPTENILAKLGSANYIKCKNTNDLITTLNKYDLVYSKNEILEAFLLKFLVGYKNIPRVIFGCHTSLHYSADKSFRSAIRNFLYGKSIYSFLTSGVHTFHTLNTTDENILKSYFNGKPIYKIYNPFNFESFLQNLPGIESKFNFSKDKIKILWLGILHTIKGTDRLSNIIKEVNKNDLSKNLEWIIAGDGQDRIMIDELSKVEGNIKVLGFVQSELVPDLINHVDLVISTSRSESFGYTVLEANALNKPFFSFRTQGQSEIIQDNVNGVIFESEESFSKGICDFISGKYKFENIAEKIRPRFNSDFIYSQIFKMFEEVFYAK